MGPYQGPVIVMSLAEENCLVFTACFHLCCMTKGPVSKSLQVMLESYIIRESDNREINIERNDKHQN